MKKPLYIVILCFALTSLMSGWAVQGSEESLDSRRVFAQGEDEKGWKVIPAGEVIYQDYGAIGEVVEISGTVIGDVYAAGGQIFVDGVIDGDLLAVGGVVHISGQVTQNVRVVGGQVVVSGEIGRNATIAARDVTFTDSGVVKGSVVVGGANVFLVSSVGKKAKVAGRNLALMGAVGEDVEAAVENIRLGARARVGGNFTYWSNREAMIDEGVIIAGATVRKAPQQLLGRLGKTAESVTRLIKPILGIVSFFTTLVLGLLLIRLFPGYTQGTSQVLRKHIWRSFTSGITALLLTPVLFGVLIITIVGIPLGFLLLLASSVMLYVARIFVILLIGQIILDRFYKQKGEGLAFFVGLVLYSLLAFIPVVGWFVSFGAALFGLGAAIETVKELYTHAKKGKIFET